MGISRCARWRPSLDQRRWQRSESAESIVVSWVEASLYDAGTAYATFDRSYLWRYDPHVFKTTDFGKTWTPIIVRTAVCAATRMSSRKTRGAQFAIPGTEFGLWISLDGGKHWAHTKVTNSMVAVRDIVVHPRESDLCGRPPMAAVSGSWTTSRRCVS